MKNIHQVVVAIPVRNEEALLPACLKSVAMAISTLRQVYPGVRTCVVVALDGCTDGSGAVALSSGNQIVTLAGVGVGATRDAAIVHGLSCLSGPQMTQTWLACTDADTVVPPTWLVRQLMWANSGMDLVVGTVEPFGLDDPRLLATWHSKHQLTEGHPHVHGANLGVRASTWSEVDGFGPRSAHEDVALVARSRSHTSRWVATDTTRVATSGRRVGRAESGFADYLGTLSVPQ
ncbi:glycosyltransferase family 2 protein [Ornithinimicrobium sp. INDO-MA30-4]|uniref:glycosyltransferase n=1 Tax=Ornithinimicrobium sp. INDO-MA30-4 TaxID=2908651 RepID=UPI001F1E962B|nr:glycosyltransferase family A protein [Ornithinimicrobium sp. INDO-MA30-4]UJH70140.1 glycosyltransferase family 2 protein [Ornithinimicrobium sp. INDO-MA30-4]